MEPNLSTEATGAAATPTHRAFSPALMTGAIAVIIIGAIAYFFMAQQNFTAPLSETSDTTMMAAPVQSNESLSTSDEATAIEEDVDNAYMAQIQADIDADLAAIEQY